MEYYYIQMTNKTPIYIDNKIVGYLNGYAIIDEEGKCFRVVYGETKRNLLLTFLNK